MNAIFLCSFWGVEGNEGRIDKRINPNIAETFAIGVMPFNYPPLLMATSFMIWADDTQWLWAEKSIKY